MTTPHVHAELIKAWADGASIEVLLPQGWEVTQDPAWYEDKKYRIKTPKVTRWMWIYKYPQDTIWNVSYQYRTEEEVKHWTGAKTVKLEWSAMEFDE